MSSRPWHPSSDLIPRKRPYSPPESPRNTRMRNAIHKDLLFNQGVYPTYACFSARGSRAISCFRDGFARVWNVDPVHDRFLDCEQVLSHAETVYRAAISDDGTRAITTCGDGIARVWDLSRPNGPSREVGSQYRSTRSCDVTSDGRYVAATFYTGKKIPMSKFQGTVVLYDPDEDIELFRRPISGVPDKVRVSRDGRVVAVGCYGITPAKVMARDTRLTLFDINGECRYFFPRVFHDEGSCNSWDLSDDGRFVAICAQNRSVIELYSELAVKQWASPPRVLRVGAPLIYEKVRIVDDGDLVTTLAMDTITRERSILVFRPSTGNILFSLACGLNDSKSCVDLEPRVCYVAATYERAERKVIRLLSRTGGDGASLKLVRCGDPPKSAYHGTSMKTNSAPSSMSPDKLSPSVRSGETGMVVSPPAARLLNDSPTPARPQPMTSSPRKPHQVSGSPAKPQVMNASPPRPQQMIVSPTPANTGPIRSTLLPGDDTFALDKRNGGDTIMAVTGDANSNAPTTMQVSPVLSTSNLSIDTSPAQRLPELPLQEPSTKENEDISNQPAQVVQTAGGSASDITKTLQTSQGANQGPEIKPTTPDTKSKFCELLRAKNETLRCKSTLAAKSTVRQGSPPVNAIVTGNAKEPSTTGRDQTFEVEVANGQVPEAANKSSQAPEKQERVQSREETALNNSTSRTKAPKIVNENNDNTGKQADSTNPQSTDPDVEMKEAPISNLKKPRWQRMLHKQPPGSRVGRRENGTLTVDDNGIGNLGSSRYRTKSEGTSDGDTTRLNGVLDQKIPARSCEEPLPTPWQGSATSPGFQGPDEPATVPGDKATKTAPSPADAVGNNPSACESKEPYEFASPRAKSGAKAEIVLSYSNAGNSPQPLPTASCTETKGVSAKCEVKPDTNHVYKNRYFIALEAAKGLFRQTSHDVEGEQILSNVKGFKTMMELLRSEKEVLDPTTVARIVYEKGGIRDALDENLFLEAFSVIYDQVQTVRERLWSEVYDQAGAEEEGLLVFHARDLITRECSVLNVELNPVWNNETLDEVIASYSTDGVLVCRDAFVQAADHIFSI